MECREVLKVLNRLADESYACDWDNVGLLAGRMDKEIWRVTVALDADDRAVEEAVAEPFPRSRRLPLQMSPSKAGITTQSNMCTKTA